MQIFGQFETDKAPSQQYGLFHPLIHSLFDVICVLQSSQRVDSGQIHSRQRWTKRGGPGCEDQLVEGFLVLAAGHEIFDADRPGDPVDRFDVAPCPNIQPKSRLQTLWCGH